MEWFFFTIIFMCFSAIFSGLETAFVSLDKVWLHGKLEGGSLNARILNFFLNRSESTLGGFLVGTNFCDVGTVISFSKFLYKFIQNGDLNQTLIALVLTPSIYFFSTLIPKIVFKAYANEICYYLSFLIAMFYFLLYPFQFVFTLPGKLILRIFKVNKTKWLSKDEFTILIKSKLARSIFSKNEENFIEKIISLKEIKAREIMMPLVRMSCVEVNEPVKIAIALMGATGLTRLPVFDIRVDNMIGYIEIKNLIRAKKTENLKKYIKKGIYVTEFTPISDLLIQMKKQKTQMAFVVDEYGGVTGIITNQDIIKELFEELHEKENLIVKEKNYWVVNPIINIEDLNEELKLNIRKEGFETLGGFIISRMKRIPCSGEKIVYSNYIFEVLSSTPTRIKQVKIYKKKRKIKMDG